MEAPEIELPPPEELTEWLRETRREHDVTQTELAERADVSPSQISRIESQSGGTAYRKMYRLQRELLTIIADDEDSLVEDVLAAKHAALNEEYELVSAAPDQTVATAAETMRQLQVSQLPVMTQERESVGRFTERDLLTIDMGQRAEPIDRFMRSPFPEVPADTLTSIARDILETNEAMLVTPSKETAAKDGTHEYRGILTPSDFGRDFENAD